MKNTRYKQNIMVSLVDKNGTMFYEVDGVYKPVYDLEEHLDRLTFMSDQNHIYMDDIAFRAYGEKPLRDKFTRVFTHTKTFAKNASTKFRIHHMSELNNVVSDKEQYENEKTIFFIGGEKFLQLVAKYCNTSISTVITNFECVPEGDNVVLEKFPKDIRHYIYGNRKTPSSSYKDNMEFNNKVKNSSPKPTVTIAENGMKIIDKSVTEYSDKKELPLVVFEEGHIYDSVPKYEYDYIYGKPKGFHNLASWVELK